MFSQYREIVKKVDAKVAELEQQHADWLVCQKGCAACCGDDVAFFAIEVAHIADWIAQQGDELQAAIFTQLGEYRARGASTPCPLLKDGACLVYPVRPVTCRSHGLLLNIATGGAPKLMRSCNLNYSDRDIGEFSAAEALSQPLLSALLAQVNGLTADAGGWQTDERRHLTELDKLATRQ